MFCKNCKTEKDTLYGKGIFCSQKCKVSFGGKSNKKPYGNKIAICNDCKCEIIIPSNQSLKLIRRCDLCKKIYYKSKSIKKSGICENCNVEHDGSYATGRFCSKKCSCSFSASKNRIITNKKISDTLKLKHKKIILIKTCKYCNNEYNANKKSQVYCSRICTNRNIARLGGLESAKIQSENRRSKNEILFADLCKKHFSEVLTNVNMFNGWDADVIIPEIKYAILWNGNWHHKKITKNHSILQVQNRDKIKIKEIKSFGYEPYVIDDFGKVNENFVNLKFKEFLDYLNKNI